MEIAAFATHVLHSSNLPSKLIDPGRLTDEEPGKGSPVDTPARDAKIAWSAERSQPFPKMSRWEDDRIRGQILHSFANHELLALELMAQALHRYPHAGPGFRRTLAATMRDEQRHLQLYLARMRQLGVEFGDFPLNRYFWDVMADLPDPITFVCHMSLTFEQANLDFCTHFRNRFREFGDDPTADILSIVYEDEIRHVRHGMMHLDQRRGDKGQWEFYQQHLHHPVTPRRARGIGFDRQGRVAAGLDPAFIDAVEVCGHSKGRVGRVLLYHPTCDHEAGDATQRQVSRSLRSMIADDECLPLFLAQEGDLVLAEREPTLPFLRHLRSLGFSLPRFSSKQHWLKSKRDQFSSFDPWGWSPEVHALWQKSPKSSQTTIPWRDPVASPRRCFSKHWSHTLEIKLLEKLGDELDMAEGDRGMVVENIRDWTAAVRRFSRQGYPWVLVKGFYGTSGRNSRRWPAADPMDSELRAWLERRWKEHGAVIVEPLMDRLVDGGVQIDCDRPGQPLIGLSFFDVTSQRQCASHWLGRRPKLANPADQRTLDRMLAPERVRSLAEWVAQALRSEGYRGKAGIDFFVYRDPKGHLRHRRLVEVNPRYTLGHVALALEKRIAAGSWARWHRVPVQQVSTSVECFLGSEDLDETGRIVQGRFFTNDPRHAQHRVGVVDVFRTS